MTDNHLANYRPWKQGHAGALTAKVAEVLRHRAKGRADVDIVGWTGLRLSVVRQILAEHPITKKA